MRVKEIKKLIYLTFGDQYSGVYQSQVIDVLEFLETNDIAHPKLIAFVPYTNYLSNRKVIKNAYPGAKILPMIPSRNHWTPLYSILLFPWLIFNLRYSRAIFARGIWACSIAISLRPIFQATVIYDGRGAAKAEWKEYLIENTNQKISRIEKAEKHAVTKSDKQLAVSQKLIDYWTENYAFSSKNFVVIPCTINQLFEQEHTIKVSIKELDLKKPIIAYAGGTDKWQSFDLLTQYAQNLLSKSPDIQFLFLTKKNSAIINLQNQYPDRVLCLWVAPAEVRSYLELADYGIIIREPTITNKVSSPTKIAEYLASGLTPIISDSIGDYSEALLKSKIAISTNLLTTSQLTLAKQTAESKLRNRDFCLTHFTKTKFKNQYINLVKG